MVIGTSPEVLYEEREKRVRDVIALREPDRVPVVLTMNYFPARYAGEVTVAESYSNYDVWWQAAKKTIVDLQPDLYSAGAGGSGLALKSLGPKLYRWAGDGLEANSLHQYIEGESLKAEEYDVFLSDPGDFTLRRYLPRVWAALEPFLSFPHSSRYGVHRDYRLGQLPSVNRRSSKRLRFYSKRDRNKSSIVKLRQPLRKT